MGEHRVPVLNAGMRRYIDPEKSPDPRIRALVADLRTLVPAPAPRAHFRAELRAQLVAVAPRLIAEGVSVESAGVAEGERREPAHRPAHAAKMPVGVGLLGRLSTVSIARPFAIVTALVAIVAMVLSTAVWMSKKALPGDPLYSLKRANEDVQLSLTSGGTERGKTLLSFASTRADEIEALLSRASALALGNGANAASGINTRTAKLINSTLDSADDDVASASRLFGSEAVKSKTNDPLSAMLNWAPGQATRPQKIIDRIPAGQLHDRAVASQTLVMAALNRSNLLSSLIGCACLDSAPSDNLGPIPCTVCSLPTLPTTPSGNPTSPATSTSAENPNTPTPTDGTGSSTPPSSGGSSSPGGVLPTISVPPITLPTLPSGLPTLPTLFPTGTASCLINLLGICIPRLG